MRQEQFTSQAWGDFVRGMSGDDACMPRELPTQLVYAPPLVRQLTSAVQAVGQLAGITRGLPNPRLLIRSFVNREAVLSSRIEGTQASLSDLFLFEISPRVEDTVPDVREVQNYARALDHGIIRSRLRRYCQTEGAVSC